MDYISKKREGKALYWQMQPNDQKTAQKNEDDIGWVSRVFDFSKVWSLSKVANIL